MERRQALLKSRSDADNCKITEEQLSDEKLSFKDCGSFVAIMRKGEKIGEIIPYDYYTFTINAPTRVTVRLVGQGTVTSIAVSDHKPNTLSIDVGD
jgi:hypothetical protein